MVSYWKAIDRTIADYTLYHYQINDSEDFTIRYLQNIPLDLGWIKDTFLKTWLRVSRLVLWIPLKIKQTDQNYQMVKIRHDKISSKSYLTPLIRLWYHPWLEMMLIPSGIIFHFRKQTRNYHDMIFRQNFEQIFGDDFFYYFLKWNFAGLKS